MKERRDMSILASWLSTAIALIFMLIRLAGGAALWAAGRLALLFALMSAVFLALAFIFDYLSQRKPPVRAFPWRYMRLKSRTAQKLARLKAEGRLTQSEIHRQKGAFLVIARKCGVDQEKARDDFELKIRKAVMNHDDT